MSQKTRSQNSERGSALVEFVLCFSFFWVPLFFGTLVLGLNLVRAIQTTQVCRDAGHMYAFGTDFSQPANQNLLVSLASGLNMTATGGNGVVVLSTITYADATACQAAGLQNNCPNQGQAVFTRRIVIGNQGLHPSAFGTPVSNIMDNGGNISNTNYLTDTSAVASGFLNVIALQSSTQLAYVAEMWVISPDYNWWSVLGSSGSSARAIF
jgi:hypothetical protein